jgi:O-methyltransferase
MAMTAFIRNSARALVRRFGFDVIRYRPVPADLDQSIGRTIRAVQPFTMTSSARVAALCEAVRYVSANGIEGAIVECGVWKGGSMMAVARTLLDVDDGSRRLFLFDTFEGMTPPTEKDVAMNGKSAAELLERSEREDAASVWCVAPLEGVRQLLQGTGYDMRNVTFVQGRVEDTLPGAAPEKIALLRLDTDWYESTRHELEHLFPRLVPGGVLIIDDYGHWSGARQAVDEYLKQRKIPLLLNRIDYSGRAAIKWQP